MALFDSADLLSRTKALAKRPATDAEMADADWYSLLTEAQLHWTGTIAAIQPEVLYGAPELLTSADGGYTYTLASYPMGHVEVRASRAGELLRPGPDWDEGADFTPEGQTLRIPNGRTRSFSSGPYARYVAMPGTIAADTEPSLPTLFRALLPPRACAIWASQGGYRDPTPFLALEQKLWGGDPNLPGDVGLLGVLKTQYYGAGMGSRPAERGAWWRGMYGGA